MIIKDMSALMDEKSLGQLLIIWNVMSGGLAPIAKAEFYSRFGIESKRGKVTQEVIQKSQRIDRFWSDTTIYR